MKVTAHKRLNSTSVLKFDVHDIVQDEDNLAIVTCGFIIRIP